MYTIISLWLQLKTVAKTLLFSDT